VKWSLPVTHPEGPAAGLAFADPSPEAAAWLDAVLDGSAQPILVPEPPERAILLEVAPFLREIYGQEIRNWAELRGEAPVEVVAVDEPARWLDEIGRAPATIAIMDLDQLAGAGLSLYQRVRARPSTAELPIIIVGAPAVVEPLAGLDDHHLMVLRKPMRFGVLMNTVRVLLRDAA
jgi:CheY-like chemotaxis protein